jgi:hypothetical protein
MTRAHGSRNRLRVWLAALAVAASTAALPAAVATSEAAAAGPAPVLEGSDCWYKGLRYSDGSTIQHDNGIWRTCTDGKWK